MWLIIEDLTLSTHKHKIFDNANLDIDNEKIVVYCDNSQHNTLLLEILSRNRRYGGEIYLDVQELTHFSKREFSDTVTYICNQPRLFTSRSVAENINVLCIEHQRLFKYLKYFKCNLNGKAKVKKLSTEERYLLNLTLGLCQNSDILLIDNPFSQLSSINQRRLVDLLEIDKRKIILTTDERINNQWPVIHLCDGGFKYE